MKRGMIHVAAGSWVNYATTLWFQVAFAARFGASLAAQGFIIYFALAAALSGILISAAQVVGIPRLVLANRELNRSAVTFLATICVAGVAIGIVAFIAAGPIAQLSATAIAVPVVLAADLIRLSAVFISLQVVVGAAAILLLASGDRFLPLAAPAIPSLAGIAWLSVAPDADVATTLLALDAGVALEGLVLLGVLVTRRFRLMEVPIGRIGAVTVATLVVLAGSSLVLPAQLMLAASEPGAAAQLNYAIRSLQVAQQLLIGGLPVVVLVDWSSLRADRSSLADTVVAMMGLVAVVLVTAASIALVAAPAIVGLAYQRGTFTAGDTRAVADLLVLALPGFCAEGMALVVGQAIAATSRNWTAAGIGVFRLVAQGTFIALLAGSGARGMALAYSGSWLLVMAVVAATTIRVLDVPSSKLERLARPVSVTILIVATAAALMLFASTWQPYERAVAVAVSALAAILFAGLHSRWAPLFAGSHGPRTAT